MDFRLLELFLRVAETGSINRAAAALNLSQPALSRHMAALEHAMGASLLVRTRGGVRLTEAGTLLCDRARPLLRQAAILKEQVGERAAGQLSIGTPPAWQATFTSPFAAAMLERHPGVRLRIHEGTSGVLGDVLAAGLLDLAIVPHQPTPPPGYASTSIAEEPLAVVGGREADLRRDEPVEPGWLRGRNLILPGAPNVLRRLVEEAMRRGGHAPEVVAEVDTLGLCLDLARRGLGLTVVPISSLADGLLGDRISWSPMPEVTVAWALLENEARGHAAAVRQGRRLALGIVREHVGEVAASPRGPVEAGDGARVQAGRERPPRRGGSREAAGPVPTAAVRRGRRSAVP